eukprot:TRINITY_DN63597_c0_g1_i1.p1 TRINITY_DN63597_c0_g1~~TRINITY_DN63597_c0_g1_i1.p1  ORF type:complete len:532 (+),score=53.18 TRINITY_DN63597_c0_g1_i1:137-1732(+)
MHATVSEDLEKQTRVPIERRIVDNGSCSAPSNGAGASFGSSAVTLTALIMGYGVLALPRVFALCGVLPTLLLLALFASWIETSLRWIVACGRFSGCCTFEGTTHYFLGPVGARVVRSAQVALLFGGIVSCFVVVTSLLTCIPSDLLNQACGTSRLASIDTSADSGILRGGEKLSLDVTGRLRFIVSSAVCWAHPMPCLPRGRLIATVTAILLPLSTKTSLHALRGLTTVGLVGFVYFFLVILMRLIFAVRRGMPMAMESADNGAFWQGPPILLMSFLCHTSILRLDGELSAEARPSVGAVIRTVVLRIAFPVYVLVGVCGFWLCGPCVSSNVLEAFENDAGVVAARLTLGFLNMVKIPLGIVALRQVVLSSLPWPAVQRHFEETVLGRFVVTAALLMATSIAASSLGSLSRVLSLMGCTVGVLFSLCLPAVLYWQLLGCIELCASTDSDRAQALRRPLLLAGKGSGRGCSRNGMFGVGGVCSAAAAAARVDGAVELPKGRAAWQQHRLACITIFGGGVVVGILGFSAWLGG